MALITFTSDFGICDHYVASVKAKILCAFPSQTIVDISHQVPSCDIAHAAFLVQSVYHDFPKGSVHVVAVNTTQAQSGRHLLILHNGHYFIGPDNGLFTLLLEEELQEVLLIESEQEVNAFPAAQLYAPIAVQLLQEEPLQTIGKPTGNYQKLLSRTPQHDTHRIKGHVVHVDGTGNLITNISKTLFDALHRERTFSVRFEYEQVYQLADAYDSVDYGDCAVLFNSNGWLEIAINQGHASELLGMQRNSPVEVRFTHEEEALKATLPAETPSGDQNT